jgi:hypothetical protein
MSIPFISRKTLPFVNRQSSVRKPPPLFRLKNAAVDFATLCTKLSHLSHAIAILIHRHPPSSAINCYKFNTETNNPLFHKRRKTYE